MKNLLTAVSVGALAVVGVVVAGLAANAAPEPKSIVRIAERASNFQLTDHRRLAHQLYYFKEAPAIVLMTQVNGSERSRQAMKELQKLSEARKDSGVRFYLLNSVDSREAVAKEVAALGLDLPVLVDELQLVADQLGVEREGQVFVIDPKSWKVAYHGPLDERFAANTLDLSKRASKSYAAAAIDALRSGAVVSEARVPVAVGKEIRIEARAEQASYSAISYATDVAPILQEKCVVCHQVGGVAPFEMNSYETVKAFAPMIRESVVTKRMPPYFADPHIGTFKNDQSLSPEQTKTLVRWIDAGSLRGDGGDPLKEKLSVAPDWPTELGQPDAIVDIPAFDVPASGVVDYQYPKVPNPFNEDVWLKAMVVKPGASQVVHHVTSNYRADPSKPTPKFNGGSVGSWAPGGKPQILPPDTGASIPAGGTLEFSMHYTPTGKAMTDKTQVGFYLHKSPPKYVNRAMVIQDPVMTIPAGSQRHKEVAYLEFPGDAYVYTLAPHAHYRGYNVELKSRTPDGKETLLLSVPKYDFNWQREYDPVEPILVKAGTKLIVTWIFDNSPANRANPDPTQTITWGEQSWDEMMYFRVNYRWAEESLDTPRHDLQQKLVQGRVIGQLDENMDGRVQKNELVGFLTPYQAKFVELDKDGSGDLDVGELTAGNVTREIIQQLQRRETTTSSR